MDTPISNDSENGTPLPPIKEEAKPVFSREDASNYFNKLTIGLNRQANVMLTIGTLFLLLTIGLVGCLYIDIKDSIDKHLSWIAEADASHLNQMMSYLMFRIFTLGGIITALLIFAYNMIKATFDQAVRYSKRRHAALFLEFLHTQYTDRILEMKFEHMLQAFEAWNKATESSFTNIKVTDRNFFVKNMEAMIQAFLNIKKNEENKSK